MEDEYIIDFSDIILPKTEFVAKFNPLTGEVSAIGPKHGFQEDPNIVVIDDDIALSVLEGKTPLSSCVVDVHNGNFSISEIKSLCKIDDLLHRLIDLKFYNSQDIDLFLTIERQTHKFTVALSENFGGTLPAVDKKIRNIFWKGDTSMYFFITDYNDPNILYKTIVINLDQLIGTEYSCEFSNIPNNFSVYTRRLFKNCVIEYK